MPTFDQLVTRVRQQLRGYTKDQEALGELAVAMTSGDTSFTVDTDTVDNLSRGLVEIDDELILVKTFDRTTGVVSVMGLANGRGAEGTTAAAHAVNSLVTSSPAYPRARVKEAINDTILALYPDLVVFDTTELTRVAVQFEYELPADVADVWYVTGELIGPTKVWQPLPNWRFNPRAATSDFPTGKSLQQLDGVVPGQKVRVVYAKEPTVLSAGADDFATVTGFPDRVSDVVVWGTCARLLPAAESARLQQQAIEATERAVLVPPQSAVKTAQYYQALYYQRLEEERRRMFHDIPNFATFQGS
ncbi:phage adaptor protein [Streptomyces halobius]|uniref:Uncharacterized protein n=1 Tax=Streptomyces halobius TaxID=2879846 RepID=A0ABY4M1K7_9ACTN|nr:hypothetical protein [Streptomyces halobius]UQA91629.1 hypothetical protein K9S39_06940 [Streptomyces halobius]